MATMINTYMIKTKVKSYGDKLNTKFKGKKIPKKMHHTNVYH